MENVAKILRERWIKKYMIRIIFSIFLIAVLLLTGRQICFLIRPIWYPEDVFYGILHSIDDNPVFSGLVVLTTIIITVTIIELSHISKVIGQITQSVEIIYTGSEEEIELPKDFKEIEMGLRKIQLDNRINENAAKEANQRKNDMIMYMAHDLKTPLTSVIGYLSILHDEKELSDQVKRKYADIALRKALRLEDLINSFFEITRYNFTQMFLEKSSVNMSRMLLQIVSEFEPLFQEKSLSCIPSVQQNVEVVCDIDKMERVYDNLFKNIVNYSYPDTEIAVTLEKNGDSGMRLLTVNKGKTIPEEKLEYIFDQFFRIDSSRSSESGGSGLGLAVTKEIVELHGGTIQCKSEKEEIIFEIEIP